MQEHSTVSGESGQKPSLMGPMRTAALHLADEQQTASSIVKKDHLSAPLGDDRMAGETSAAGERAFMRCRGGAAS